MSVAVQDHEVQRETKELLGYREVWVLAVHRDHLELLVKKETEARKAPLGSLAELDVWDLLDKRVIEVGHVFFRSFISSKT